MYDLHYEDWRRVKSPGKPLPITNDGIIDLSGLTLGFGHHIDCNVHTHSLRETFTTTVSQFYNTWPQSVMKEQGMELAPIPIKVVINTRAGTSEVLSSPGAFSENEILLQPNQTAIIRFRSIRDEERRDWYLVLIGACVAFGAALLLESVRPYIERIGEKAV